MTAKYWIKLYHEILDDPKMGKLPDWLWRRCVELFLIAGQYDRDGMLPPVEEMLWILHLNDEMKLSQALQMLAEVGVTFCDDQGCWWVKNFSKRQSANDSSERGRKYRERQRHIQPNDFEQKTNETFVDRDRDRDRDTDRDRDSENARAPNHFEKLRCAAERLTGLMMTSADIKTLSEWDHIGVVEEDIAGALLWRKENNKPPVKTISQLAGGIETERTKRIQGEVLRKPKQGVSLDELKALGYTIR